MAKKGHVPRPGDVFAVEHRDGRWGALRVLKKIVRTSCVMVTEYLDASPPTLDDPRLRRVQRYTWWEPGVTGGPKTPCVSWYDGALPASFVHVGVLPPNASERKLGGKDAGYGYSGHWSEGMGWEVLWAERHARDPEAFRAEQERDAARPRSRPRGRAPMEAARFWKLIAKIEGRKLAPLVHALSRESVPSIEAFHERLARVLHRLDGRVFAEQIGEQAYRGPKHFFSVDNFLYVRAAVVARGEAFYKSVLRDPTNMPKDDECEDLLFVPEKAFRKKKKNADYAYDPTCDWETFANERGW